MAQPPNLPHPDTYIRVIWMLDPQIKPLIRTPQCQRLLYMEINCLVSYLDTVYICFLLQAMLKSQLREESTHFRYTYTIRIHFGPITCGNTRRDTAETHGWLRASSGMHTTLYCVQVLERTSQDHGPCLLKAFGFDRIFKMSRRGCFC